MPVVIYKPGRPGGQRAVNFDDKQSESKKAKDEILTIVVPQGTTVEIQYED